MCLIFSLIFFCDQFFCYSSTECVLLSHLVIRQVGGQPSTEHLVGAIRNHRGHHSRDVLDIRIWKKKKTNEVSCISCFDNKHTRQAWDGSIVFWTADFQRLALEVERERGREGVCVCVVFV